jgi:hypothetical protein
MKQIDIFFIFLSETSVDVYAGSRPLTFTTVSRILLTPTAEEDGTRMRCEARHPAMEDDKDDKINFRHLKDEVTLKVLCELNCIIKMSNWSSSHPN